jgi:hypothetical protein
VDRPPTRSSSPSTRRPICLLFLPFPPQYRPNHPLPRPASPQSPPGSTAAPAFFSATPDEPSASRQAADTTMESFPLRIVGRGNGRDRRRGEEGHRRRSRGGRKSRRGCRKGLCRVRGVGLDRLDGLGRRESRRGRVVGVVGPALSGVGGRVVGTGTSILRFEVEIVEGFGPKSREEPSRSSRSSRSALGPLLLQSKPLP